LRHVWALAVLASPATVTIPTANAANSPNIPKRMMHLHIRPAAHHQYTGLVLRGIAIAKTVRQALTKARRREPAGSLPSSSGCTYFVSRDLKGRVSTQASGRAAIIQPLPGFFVGPTRNGEAAGNGNALTVAQQMAFGPGVMHRRGVGSSAQTNQET